MDIRSENDKKSGYEVQMEAEERVIVFAVTTGGVSVEDTEKSLDELEELLETAGAATVGRLIQSLDRATSDLYLGSGKVEELRSMVAMYDATGVDCDDELSPAQLMNLQDALNIKVMDRTMVILVLPYHKLGIQEWERLGIPYKLEGIDPPTEEQQKLAKSILEN